jgi:toxin ParE1/3/4
MAWTVRLAAQAELDFVEILAWTVENFGETQADIYAETLTLAIEALHDGPLLAGTQARDEFEPGIRTLHVARRGKKGRHFVVFRQTEDRCIDVLRFLHDGMDLARHIH